MNNNQRVYTYTSGGKFSFYRSIFILILLLILTSVLFTGCMPNTTNYTVDSPAGFFSGIWHGWIAPISLIMSFFGDGGIYAVNNTGFPYDLGFYLSIVSGFGGLSLTRKRFRNREVIYKYENEV